ncbi:hypothetical protein [Roseivirga sp.]|uniref:hypothetical protein n=1 Tax=Roseivirga sp. TaxID=1964215 RepID=UPI003B8DBD93
MKRFSHYHKFSFTIIIFTLISACNPQQELSNEIGLALESKSSALGQKFSEKEVLVVIPRTGCSGCIGTADHFYKEANYDPTKVQFIFTRIPSVKTLKIRLGKDISEKDYVYIDQEGTFSKGKLDSIYPLIIQLSNGEVLDIEFLSPDNKQVIIDLRDRFSVSKTNEYPSEI